MRIKGFTVILIAGVVFGTMLACSISSFGNTEVPIDSGASPSTESPEIVLPPPVTASMKVVYSKAGNVWIWTEGGSPQQLIFGGGASTPRLSADGQIVAFNHNGELWAVNTDGSAERTLVDLAFLSQYANTPGDEVVVDDILWLGQTHQIVFNTLEISQGSGYQLQMFDYKVANSDSGISATSSPKEGGVPYDSPDGNWLAMAQPDKVILRYNSGSVPWVDALDFPVILTYSEWLYVPQLVWLSDSSAVRMVIPANDPMSDPEQVSSFWNIPVSGAPSRLATFKASPAYMYAPFVSPDGHLVVYQVDHGATTEIHTITDDGIDSLMLSFPVNTVELTGWHPDSVRFMFTQPDPVHANLGSAGFSQPLGDTPKVQNIRWVDPIRFLFTNDGELRFSDLGGSSTLIDTGVNEYDLVFVSSE